MRPISILCIVTCLALASAASARGGHSSMSMMGGGAFGTSASRPGTNSLGTALSSPERGGHAMSGPLLGTDRALVEEDARLEKMLEGSICRGC